MDPAAPSGSSFWSFLWGKRGSRRCAVGLPAKVHGPLGAIGAWTVNVSAGGVLLRLPTEGIAKFFPEEPALGLTELRDALGDAFTVEFLDRDVRMEARMVRLAWGAGSDDPDLYLGCRFGGAFETGALRRLGVPDGVCGSEGEQTRLSHLMRYVVDPSKPLTLAVKDDQPSPLFSLPLLGVHGSALAASLAPADPTEVVACLSRRTFEVEVSHEAGALWTGTAHLLAARPLVERADGVEIVLLAGSAPGPAVTERMRRNATEPESAETAS